MMDFFAVTLNMDPVSNDKESALSRSSNRQESNRESLHWTRTVLGLGTARWWSVGETTMVVTQRPVFGC